MPDKQILTFVTVVALLSGLAVAPALAQNQIAPNAVAVDRKNGVVSLQLPLLRTQTFKFADGVDGLIIEFGGAIGGKPVGMYALISMNWEAHQVDDTPSSFWWSAVSLERSGEQSDNLVRVISGLYGIKDLPRQAKKAIPLRVVSLAQRPSFAQSQMRLEAFIEGGTEGDYAEFYLNIDFQAQTVSITEKDPKYRDAIVRAISSSGSP